MGEPDGLLQKYSPESDNISAPRAEHSELGDWMGRGVEGCSDLGDWPGLRVGRGFALGDSLRREDLSELGESLGLGVEACSALRD